VIKREQSLCVSIERRPVDVEPEELPPEDEDEEVLLDVDPPSVGKGSQPKRRTRLEITLLRKKLIGGGIIQA